MAKYFLGSVGKAEAFRMNADNKLELMFVSKTLTDSGLNISITKDDIRGGEGAPIQFSFYHDPSVEITLTDIQFKKEYVTAQLGAEFEEHPESYQTFEYELSTTAKKLNVKPIKMPIPCGEDYVVWACKKGTDKYISLIVTEEGSDVKVALPTGEEAGTYCVRYLAHDAKAKVAEVTANIIPSELFLIITAPIFAGDACAASRGKAAGSISFEVPRFLLNGGQEFTMNMSSNQTMSLSGIALSTESGDCEANGGKLLRIIEVINDRDWAEGLTSLVFDPDYNKVGDKVNVYGVYNDGHVGKALIEELTFTPADMVTADFKFAKTGTVKAAKGSIESAQFTVEAA